MSKKTRRSLFFDGFDYINKGVRRSYLKGYIGQLLGKFGRYKDISFTPFDKMESDKYFFPLHIEPEGVVFYWGGTKYQNQIRTIFSLVDRFNLEKLYVKDHISFFGYRPPQDYKILNKGNSVVLLDNKIKAMDIIKKSKCIFVLSGTPGMEAFLLGKHVINLGRTYYSFVKSVKYVPDIDNISFQEFTNYLSTPLDQDNSDKIQYLTAFYKGSYDWKVNYWDVDKEGGRLFAEGLFQETNWFLREYLHSKLVGNLSTK